MQIYCKIKSRNREISKKEFLRVVFTIMLVRTVVNLPRRFAFPFIPEISRQLNVSLASVQGVIATQSGVGVIAPVFTPLSDRRGRKQTMLLAVGLLTIGSMSGAFFPRFGAFYIVMVVLGIAKIIYDPAAHAYIGDRISYNRRGAAIGIVELSWSLSLVISAPLAGILLDLSGLRAIFVCVSILSAISLAGIWLILPGDKPTEVPHTKRRADFSNWQLLIRNPAAIAALIYAITLSSGAEIMFIVYGAWMEKSFEVVLTTLGLVTIVIAIAEVVGELAVIGLSDRIGKQRLTVYSAVLACLCYLVLPFIGITLFVALLAIFILFIGVECAIVTSFSLFTEVLPEARALMITGIWSAHSVGRLLGAGLGSIIYAEASAGFTAAMLVSAGLTAFAAFMLWRFVPDYD
jgi:predicted MFS family arabinose efflux permease